MPTDTPIRVLRHVLGESQADFGQRLGLSKQAISYVEMGKCRMHPDAILTVWTRHKKACRSAGIKLEDLVRGSF